MCHTSTCRVRTVSHGAGSCAQASWNAPSRSQLPESSDAPAGCWSCSTPTTTARQLLPRRSSIARYPPRGASVSPWSLPNASSKDGSWPRRVRWLASAGSLTTCRIIRRPSPYVTRRAGSHGSCGPAAPTPRQWINRLFVNSLTWGAPEADPRRSTSWSDRSITFCGASPDPSSRSSMRSRMCEEGAGRSLPGPGLRRRSLASTGSTRALAVR